ncbi:MAG: ligase-associated DNA damage response endonuclease PdeM [Ferruginibacter sp.]|nr:ligase-associated DNA damage response endonuclease PdeM [Cytophagales bacterium]
MQPVTCNPSHPSHCAIDFRGQRLVLLPQKAIFWEDTGSLLLSDLHLGKVSHFRKAGIAVPGAVIHRDYEVLDALLNTWAVRQLVILGDLFHSVVNAEWGLFSDWLDRHPRLSCGLVKGNHDVLPDERYRLQRIQVFGEVLRVPPFVFSHVPLAGVDEGYNLSGHLHPAVKLRGEGGQQLTLPCFYFGPARGLLPAFGHFTGRAVIRPERESRVFVVAENRVFPL